MAAEASLLAIHKHNNQCWVSLDTWLPHSSAVCIAQRCWKAVSVTAWCRCSKRVRLCLRCTAGGKWCLFGLSGKTVLPRQQVQRSEGVCRCQSDVSELQVVKTRRSSHAAFLACHVLRRTLLLWGLCGTAVCHLRWCPWMAQTRWAQCSRPASTTRLHH